MKDGSRLGAVTEFREEHFKGQLSTVQVLTQEQSEKDPCDLATGK